MLYAFKVVVLNLFDSKARPPIADTTILYIYIYIYSQFLLDKVYFKAWHFNSAKTFSISWLNFTGCSSQIKFSDLKIHWTNEQFTSETFETL